MFYSVQNFFSTTGNMSLLASTHVCDLLPLVLVMIEESKVVEFFFNKFIEESKVGRKS